MFSRFFIPPASLITAIRRDSQESTTRQVVLFNPPPVHSITFSDLPYDIVLRIAYHLKSNSGKRSDASAAFALTGKRYQAAVFEQSAFVVDWRVYCAEMEEIPTQHDASDVKDLLRSSLHHGVVPYISELYIPAQYFEMDIDVDHISSALLSGVLNVGSLAIGNAQDGEYYFQGRRESLILALASARAMVWLRTQTAPLSPELSRLSVMSITSVTLTFLSFFSPVSSVVFCDAVHNLLGRLRVTVDIISCVMDLETMVRLSHHVSPNVTHIHSESIGPNLEQITMRMKSMVGSRHVCLEIPYTRSEIGSPANVIVDRFLFTHLLTLSTQMEMPVIVTSENFPSTGKSVISLERFQRIDTLQILISLNHGDRLNRLYLTALAGLLSTLKNARVQGIAIVFLPPVRSNSLFSIHDDSYLKELSKYDEHLHLLDRSLHLLLSRQHQPVRATFTYWTYPLPFKPSSSDSTLQYAYSEVDSFWKEKVDSTILLLTRQHRRFVDGDNIPIFHHVEPIRKHWGPTRSTR